MPEALSFGRCRPRPAADAALAGNAFSDRPFGRFRRPVRRRAPPLPPVADRPAVKVRHDYAGRCPGQAAPCAAPVGRRRARRSGVLVARRFPPRPDRGQFEPFADLARGRADRPDAGDPASPRFPGAGVGLARAGMAAPPGGQGRPRGSGPVRRAARRAGGGPDGRRGPVPLRAVPSAGREGDARGRKASAGACSSAITCSTAPPRTPACWAGWPRSPPTPRRRSWPGRRRPSTPRPTCRRPRPPPGTPCGACRRRLPRTGPARLPAPPPLRIRYVLHRRFRLRGVRRDRREEALPVGQRRVRRRRAAGPGISQAGLGVTTRRGARSDRAMPMHVGTDEDGDPMATVAAVWVDRRLAEPLGRSRGSCACSAFTASMPCSWRGSSRWRCPPQGPSRSAIYGGRGARKASARPRGPARRFP